MTAQAPIKPTFHHFNLKTTRLQELIDWYSIVVGAEVTFQDATGAWLTNDAANHRIALLAFPGFVDDPDKETRTGMHHSAFEYEGFAELNSSYERLRDEGIEPEICIDHGMTLSYYYKDPDGNFVELQIDNFATPDEATEYMHGPEYGTNPVGVSFVPELMREALAGGTPVSEITTHTWALSTSPDLPDPMVALTS